MPCAALLLALSLWCGRVAAAEFEWRFDNGLAPAVESGGTASLSAFNQATADNASFGVTGGAVPSPADGPTGYVYFPGQDAIEGGLGGYALDHTGVMANGGGLYVNDYTMIWDVYIPTINWTALVNTNPEHGNDSDLYIAPDGTLGIAGLGYTGGAVVSPGAWHRIAFVHDRTNDAAAYYVDGSPVFTTAASPLDGRWSLYASDNPGADLVLLGEGDGSGNYANNLYLSAFYFADRALDASSIAALGGVNAAGISVVPEPAACGLVAVAALSVLRRPRGVRAPHPRAVATPATR
jgi:hypothetical protein